MKVIRLIKDDNIEFIARAGENGNGNMHLLMIQINEEDEEKLNNNEPITKQIGNCIYEIYPNLCLAYGELNMSPNSDDIIKISENPIFYKLYIKHFLPSIYNYKHHCGYETDEGRKWYDTANPKDYLPFLHASMGKPKRICIFKHYIDSVTQLKYKKILESNSKSYYSHKKQRLDGMKKHRLNVAKEKKQKRMQLLKFKF